MSITTHNQYSINSKVRTKLKQRLMAEGRWDAYVTLREKIRVRLQEAEADGADSIAWKIAAVAFSPVNGSAPEIFVDAMYAGIVADWHAGKYDDLLDSAAFSTFPNGFRDMRKLVEEATPAEADLVKKIKKAPVDHGKLWEDLTLQVKDRQSSELDDIRWVVANRLIHVSHLDSEEIPSASALSILEWAQASPSNFGDLLRTNYSKLLPTKSELEYANRFADDGRDLDRLAEFMRIENQRPLQTEEVV